MWLCVCGSFLLLPKEIARDETDYFTTDTISILYVSIHMTGDAFKWIAQLNIEILQSAYRI